MNIFETINNLFIRKRITQEEREYFLGKDKEIQNFELLSKNEGWQVLANKMREEIRNEILKSVSGNPKIMTLLSILETADVKGQKELLEDEINNIIK